MRSLFCFMMGLGLVGCGDAEDSSYSWGGYGGSYQDASSEGSGDKDGAGPDGDLDGSSNPDQKQPDPVDSSVDGLEDASPGVETVVVSHERQLRGTWIATVSRINWPTAKTASEQKAEMDKILNAIQKTGLNTVFFQVRPEADALYESSIEPWSRYLTGTQGQSPGYDPLTYVIEGCHRRGLELHAWLNPYRARAGNVGATASNHVANTMPNAIVTYGNLLWLDPGNPQAFAHTMSVIEDLLERYDLDGIHFDDYFYPYPDSGLSFNDSASYSAHGGGMALSDWRRDNVNRMVAAVGQLVQDIRSDVRWGISPFGIYRPGYPPGVTGLDQYASLYADPLKWMQEGWLEYIAPQLYWPTTSTGQPYGKLLTWWDEQAAQSGRMMLAGNSASNAFGLAEYRKEMDAVRAAAGGATRGEIWWSVKPIVNNESGLADMLESEYYAHPAATPALFDAPDAPPSHPDLDMDEGKATVLTSPEGVRFWALYQKASSGWNLFRLVPSATTQFQIGDGTWAISVIDRSGRESLGVVVEGKGDISNPQPTGASCTHTNGGIYVDGGCSPSYQCCDGQWKTRGACGACVCEESTGEVGCGV